MKMQYSDHQQPCNHLSDIHHKTLIYSKCMHVYHISVIGLNFSCLDPKHLKDIIQINVNLNLKTKNKRLNTNQRKTSKLKIKPKWFH